LKQLTGPESGDDDATAGIGSTDGHGIGAAIDRDATPESGRDAAKVIVHGSVGAESACAAVDQPVTASEAAAGVLLPSACPNHPWALQHRVVEWWNPPPSDSQLLNSG